MVQAIIKIEDRTNRVLNIVKAKYGLRDKSQAIDLIAEQYQESILEPELKPEFIEKIKRIQKEPNIKIGSMKNFKKRYGI